MRGGPTYATRLCASLCSNGHPAIQLKYMYSTLLLALLFGRVVYASATNTPGLLQSCPLLHVEGARLNLLQEIPVGYTVIVSPIG